MGKVTLKDGKQVKRYRAPEKKMGWRYFLMWLFGFVSAGIIVVIVTAILGTTFSTRQLITMFGGNPMDLLQPEYQNISVLQMALKLVNNKYETLGDIYDITPIVKTLVDEYINPILEDELHYEFIWEELSTKPFFTPVEPREDGSVDPYEDIASYIGRAVKEGVYLASFLNPGYPDLVNIFLYPKDEYGNYDFDNPYSLMDYISADSDFFDNIMSSIKVKDVTGVTGIPLIDDEDGIGGWSINDFSDEKINSLPLSLLLDPESTNPLIVKLREEWTVGDLRNENNFKNLLLSDVITITDESPKILIRLTELGYTIGQLESTNLYNVLTVGDVFDVAGNKLLTELEGTFLSDLENEDTILSLKLGKVLPTTEEGDTIIDKFADKTLSELSDMDIHTVKLTDLFSNEEIQDENNKVLKALVDNDPDVTIGDLTDTSTIQSLKLSDILSDEQINSSSVIKALVASGTSIADVPSAINDLSIGELLDIDVNDPDTSNLLKKLATYHIDTISDFVDNITIGDVIDDFSSYPTLDNDEVKATKLSNLDDIIAVLKTHLKLQDVVDIDSNSPWILRELADKDLTQLADTIETFTLGNFIEIDNTSPLILQKLKDVPLDDLEDEINSLALEDIIEIDSSSPLILQSLSSVTILDGTSLIERVNNLMLCDIYSADDISGIFKYLWDDNNGGQILITDLPNAVNDLPLTLILEDYLYVDDVTQAKYYDAVTDTYYSYSELTPEGKSPAGNDVIEYKRINPTWWFLFSEEGETFSVDEKYYVIKNGLSYTVGSGIDDIIDNFSYHMRVEPLRELYNAGLLSIDDDKLYYLDVAIVYKGQARTVGSLTVSEFLDFCMTNLSI